MSDDERAALAYLRTPAAIRERCAQVFVAAERGETRHFALDLGRLSVTADATMREIERNYPTLDVPLHSRFRHFAAGGRDRWGEIAAAMLHADAAERTRMRVELAVVSVLLDAGAGPDWSWRERDVGQVYARSEGLAVASVAMYRRGLFSSDATQPLRVDAAALARLSVPALAAGFQVAAHNPMVGLEGRAALLQRLGAAVVARPDVFGADARVGGLADHLAAKAVDGALPAATILATLLDALAPIWPGRLSLAGENLGDVWRHPAAKADGPSNGLVPFHKLSQWLAYSLIEALQEAGVRSVDLDALTGLPEYRNGGLFVDAGVLVPKHAAVTGDPHAPDSEVIVEWRALTVILLDRIAEEIRRRLKLDAAALPLAKVLEGGTWAAGRRFAADRRPGGAPPIAVVSDGTVF